jgi:hypothetical protein
MVSMHAQTGCEATAATHEVVANSLLEAAAVELADVQAGELLARAARR